MVWLVRPGCRVKTVVIFHSSIASLFTGHVKLDHWSQYKRVPFDSILRALQDYKGQQWRRPWTMQSDFQTDFGDNGLRLFRRQ